MLDTGQLPLGGNALSLFRQGLAFAASEDYQKAVDSYKCALQLHPDCAEIWYECGLALENLGAYAEAIARYDHALELRPPFQVAAEIWHSRGNALQYGLGDYEAALRSYDRSLQLRPDHFLVWQNRGNALLYGLNRYEEAVANYDRVLFLDQNYYLAWRNRGNALVELQRFQDAIASYDQALAIEPNDQISGYARTCALNQVGLEERQPTTNPVWYGRGFTGIDEGPAVDDSIEMDMETLVSAWSTDSLPYKYPGLVIEDEKGRREIVLKERVYSIGRDPRNDICLNSQFASRFHATLVQMPQEDGSVTYRISDGDLQGKRSTNGLLVNGRKQSEQELFHEDVVTFGPNVRIIYVSFNGS